MCHGTWHTFLSCLVCYTVSFEWFSTIRRLRSSDLNNMSESCRACLPSSRWLAALVERGMWLLIIIFFCMLCKVILKRSLAQRCWVSPRSLWNQICIHRPVSCSLESINNNQAKTIDEELKVNISYPSFMNGPTILNSPPPFSLELFPGEDY